MSRAALSGTMNFARQRISGGGTRMIARDPVLTDLVTGTVAVSAATILVRQLRAMRAATTSDDPTQALWSMLAKPALTHIAEHVLSTCQGRTGAHGTLTISRLTDWARNRFGASIAEGETQVLQYKSGILLATQPPLLLPGTPTNLPVAVDYLARREHILADRIRAGDYAAAGPVLGPGSAAIALATATAERALAIAPLIAASTTDNPDAAHMLTTISQAYAIERVHHHARWFSDHHIDTTTPTTADLARHHAYLADHIHQLIEAFDTPDLPGSPLAAADYTTPYEQLTGWGPTTFISIHPHSADV